MQKDARSSPFIRFLKYAAMLTLTVYVVVGLFFGSFFQGSNIVLAFILCFSDVYLLAIPVVAFVLARKCRSLEQLKSIPEWAGPSVVFALWVVFSIVPLGVYAEWRRSEAIKQFKPDEISKVSFYSSIRFAQPVGLNFHYHAVALKDCVAYNWSYRSMSFYVLPPGSAVNVLPYEWRERCDFQKTNQAARAKG
ncbi:hypothetical protein [Rhizobium sp. AAP43]|uniref:hypothetical protein n=1 Tax=Rhizobium sp. AAP43 TaxID=1523420 RepID=UPI000A5746CC|nr:hypothetical protein [Rhizobium sp. AAP43]